MRCRLLSTLPGLFIAAACGPTASLPAPADHPTTVTETSTGYSVRLNPDARAATTTIDALPEQVWAALPEVYETLGIPAEVDDPAARVYGTGRFTQSRLAGKRTEAFVRCGNQGAGPSSMSRLRIRLSILSRVQRAGTDATVLSTDVTGSGTPIEGTSTSAVICVSTGELEQHIHALVSERQRDGGGDDEP